MLLKRILAAGIVLALSFTLCGCSLDDGSNDSLLKPPRPAGEMYDIQKALESAVKGKFTLKYPTQGDYRSAILQQDINGDGKDEAVAFYSTVADNVVTMHINLITKQNGKWNSVGNFRCVASGLETVAFKDMDKDGNLEILVGWSVYGNVDKLLGVYSFEGGKFLQRAMESYTHYLCEDVDNDGNMEVFVSHLDAKNESANAKLIRLTDTGLLELGKCLLDNTATTYYPPVLGKLKNGNSAIYFDAVKGGGLITEVLEIKDSVMSDALLLPDGTKLSTYRTSSVEIRDIEKDGVYEIPQLTPLTQMPGAENENIYVTDWYNVTDGRLNLSFSAIMNYVDCYYVVISKKWAGKIAVTRDTPNRIRNIMAIDKKTGNSADILVRIQTVPINQKGEEGAVKLENATEIARKGDFCYMVSIGDTNVDTAVTLKEFSQLFKTLD